MYLIAFTCTCRLKKSKSKTVWKTNMQRPEKIFLKTRNTGKLCYIINENLQLGGITTLN